jgi:hypothetical protein
MSLRTRLMVTQVGDPGCAGPQDESKNSPRPVASSRGARPIPQVLPVDSR